MKLIIKVSYGLTTLTEIVIFGFYLWVGRYKYLQLLMFGCRLLSLP